MKLRSLEELLEEAASTIRHMHSRPTMYIGSLDAPKSADVLDGMFWATHWLWCYAQTRESELRDVQKEVRKRHGCGPLGLADGFRQTNPEASEKDVSVFVLSCWREIDELLGIDSTSV